MSVAIDGNNILIGTDDETLNGQAHLFDATTGVLLQTFSDPTPTGKDRFGWSVDIEGNLALVGASRDDSNGLDVGQAHLFDTSTGALLQTFDDPTPTGGDMFGESVAIDGNYVLVGAHQDGTNGIEAGQAHLFDALTGSLLQTFDDPTITGASNFGESVAIADNRVVIGAGNDWSNGVQTGQAYLFTPDGSLVVPVEPPDLAAVPVPPALILFLSGLVGLGFVARGRAV